MSNTQSQTMVPRFVVLLLLLIVHAHGSITLGKTGQYRHPRRRLQSEKVKDKNNKISPTSPPTSMPTQQKQRQKVSNNKDSRTSQPSFRPTFKPSTGAPSKAPVHKPTGLPTLPPTSTPTAVPTFPPTDMPSVRPSLEPTVVPFPENVSLLQVSVSIWSTARPEAIEDVMESVLNELICQKRDNQADANAECLLTKQRKLQTVSPSSTVLSEPTMSFRPVKGRGLSWTVFTLSYNVLSIESSYQDAALERNPKLNGEELYDAMVDEIRQYIQIMIDVNIMEGIFDEKLQKQSSTYMLASTVGREEETFADMANNVFHPLSLSPMRIAGLALCASTIFAFASLQYFAAQRRRIKNPSRKVTNYQSEEDRMLTSVVTIVGLAKPASSSSSPSSSSPPPITKSTRVEI